MRGSPADAGRASIAIPALFEMLRGGGSNQSAATNAGFLLACR